MFLPAADFANHDNLSFRDPVHGTFSCTLPFWWKYIKIHRFQTKNSWSLFSLFVKMRT